MTASGLRRRAFCSSSKVWRSMVGLRAWAMRFLSERMLVLGCGVGFCESWGSARNRMSRSCISCGTSTTLSFDEKRSGKNFGWMMIAITISR